MPAVGRFRGQLTGAVWFSGIMAEEAGMALYLRAEDEDIDAAELLSVTVSESVTEKG